MVKGTRSFGKKIGSKHMRCRRCGRVSWNITRRYCAACGFKNPARNPARIRDYNWKTRDYRRKRKH